MEPACLILISFLRYWGCGMERIISRRDDFVVDVLFYFKPVQRFEYPGDMFSFRVLVTARAWKFCNSWRGDICFCSKFR